MIRFLSATLLASAAAAALAAPAAAREMPLSVQNSFRIGDSGVMCTAQVAPDDPRLKQMFDRGYRLTCKDAAAEIGTLVALRDPVGIGAIPSALPGVALDCTEAGDATIDALGTVEAATCSAAGNSVSYRRYAVSRGGVTYIVEGLAGYDPALRLALASVVKGEAVAGKVEVATSEVSDAAAFARIQAGALDALGARDEAYLRNNSGRFAEAGQFFENLVTRDENDPAALAEVLANQGLQQSNLGNFKAAGRLFDDAAKAAPRGDGVTQRLLRNYRAIDALNAHEPGNALVELKTKVAEVEDQLDRNELRQGIIDRPLSTQINRENAALREIGGVLAGLTAAERAELLDAQAQALTGMALRQQGKLGEAEAALAAADTRIGKVRDGRVVSARWLRAEIGIERGLIAEAQGRVPDAVSAFDTAIVNIGQSYPDSPMLLAARARKAGLLARTGSTAEARQLFADVVNESTGVTEDTAILRDLLQPYFALLAGDGGADASAQMFAASQVLQRPGVAQTQAVLARQLSEGNDEAASLFRLSVNRSREIARTEAEIAVLSALPEPSERQIANLQADKESLEYLKGEQTGLLAKLADFPRYKALSPQRLGLDELRGKLRAGEAYYKLMTVGGQAYALWVTPEGTQSFAVEGGVDGLQDDVRAVRDSIAVDENGQIVTYPFDIARAHTLYTKLFGPVSGQLAKVHHLIFEPDGPMLQLPPEVLVTSDKSVADYQARQKKPKADAYDFRGTDWLARGREVSISVSPRGFMDVREIAPSKAQRAYLGVGSNAVPDQRPVAAVADQCSWPLANWQHPIKPDELFAARNELGQGMSEVITGPAFTDTALLADPTLDQYRVLHFATHGLVTAPKPSCPARPALITSFGGQGSDGLLSFGEIFDLKLDADLVILSACDTAGMATVSASREAGIVTGGNYALDGLVRAFVGAGARSVVASHWPVPDDYSATKRLITGMLEAKQGESLGDSLAAAQEQLMDQAETSHPYYWGAFIILGDAARALR
ncbi:MAG: CHAT domain-containing protein [Tsuneonella sp.]